MTDNEADIARKQARVEQLQAALADPGTLSDHERARLRWVVERDIWLTQHRGYRLAATLPTVLTESPISLFVWSPRGQSWDKHSWSCWQPFNKDELQRYIRLLP